MFLVRLYIFFVCWLRDYSKMVGPICSGEIEGTLHIYNDLEIRWRDRILMNRTLRVSVILIFAAIVGPVLIYQFIFFSSLELPPSDGFSFGSCLIPRQSRLLCGTGNVTAQECHPECCYDHANGMCFHRYPSRFSYILNEEWRDEAVLTPRISTVPFRSQNSYPDIRLSIDEVSASHLSLTFYKADEVIIGRKLREKNYVYNIAREELNIQVNSTQGNIFNTAHGPLIASNNIWEISFRITDETMYGLGELPLREDTVKVIYSHKGGFSSIPLIYAKFNGSYHGLLIDTVAPTEVHIRGENNLVIRSITNWGLKFHLFVGPKPADIMNDVMALIGAEKKLEYWMLGLHVCSEPVTPESLADLRTFINSANSASMPFESHCGVAPVVFDSECNDTRVTFVNDGATALRNARKKFVPHVSPYIRYTVPDIIPEIEESSEEQNETTTTTISNTKNISNQIERCFDDEVYDQYIIRDAAAEHVYIGEADEYAVIYPKYDAVDKEFMQQLWVYSEFDGVILENNWPLDESEKNVNETGLFLPYYNENFEAVFKYTPRWNASRLQVDAIQPIETTTTEWTTTVEPSATESNVDMLQVNWRDTESIDSDDGNNTRPEWNATDTEKYLYTHNEYGNHFVKAFEMIKEGVPTISTSQWMNGNVAINRQDIETTWGSLRKELIEASLGGISGNRYWSSPICGDTENFNSTTQVRICSKWYMAATYFPMIRIHSKENRRDPLEFIGTDRAHMIQALRNRMSLMPYIYSVLQEGPLLRPMFYQFPSVDSLSSLTTQFSVGDDLLIVPNLQPDQSHVHIWKPPGHWFEFWSGLEIKGEIGEGVTMTTTDADFLTLIRGGSIIVMQENVRLTTAETRQMSPFTVLIALDCETRNITEIEEGEEYGRADTETTTAEDYSTTDAPTTTTEAPTTFTTCSAEGKFYMSSNMTILFEANSTTLTITSGGEDFDLFCTMSQPVWTRNIWYITVFGLNDDQNNYDHNLHLRETINLCNLQTNDTITYDFINTD